MGLAGEALVQSHRLRPLVDALWRLRGRQVGLLEDLQILEDRLGGTGATGTDARPRLSSAGHERLAKARRGPPTTCRAWPRRSRASRHSPA